MECFNNDARPVWPPSQITMLIECIIPKRLLALRTWITFLSERIKIKGRCRSSSLPLANIQRYSSFGCSTTCDHLNNRDCEHHPLLHETWNTLSAFQLCCHFEAYKLLVLSVGNYTFSLSSVLFIYYKMGSLESVSERYLRGFTSASPRDGFFSCMSQSLYELSRGR